MKAILVFGLFFLVHINGKVILGEKSAAEADETPGEDSLLPDKALEVSDVEMSEDKSNEDLVRVPRQYPYNAPPNSMMVPVPPSAKTTLGLKGAILGEKLPEFLIPFMTSFIGNIKPLPLLSLAPLLSHFKPPVVHPHSLPAPGFSPGFLHQLLLSSAGAPPLGRSNEDVSGNPSPYSYSPQPYMIPDLYNPYVVYVDPYQFMRSAEQPFYMNPYSIEGSKSDLPPHHQSSMQEYHKIKRELEANDLPNVLSETV